MGTRRNPAVVAGLVGASVMLPSPALAFSVDEVVPEILGSPAACFGVGVVTGAVVSGIVSAIVCHALMSRAESAVDVASTGKHFRPAAGAVAEPSIDNANEVEEAASQMPVYAPAASLFEPAPASALKPLVGSHAANDYEQIAENYVRKATFGARMATRAQGVAKTLRERMGADMMDGLPVIERADGSVADVGTSWWNTSVGLTSITKIDDYVEGSDTGDLAIPSDFTASGKEMLVSAAKKTVENTAPRPAGEFSHGSIADRIAFVDEGVYPELRNVEDAFSEDDWASALKSMDDRLGAQIATYEPIIPAPFEDIVGDADTLDEPDGLEQSTAFIPFKPMAGHPEVVDTESYVDYLIGDEFGRSESKATRNAAGRFLRVLEGGTSTSALSRRGSKNGSGSLGRPDDSGSYRPKHFAMPIAKEA